MRPSQNYPCLVSCILLLGASRVATAHDPSLSAIQVMYRSNDTVITVSTHISRLAKSEGNVRASQESTIWANRAILKRIRIRTNGKPVKFEKTTLILDRTNDQITWQTRTARANKALEVLSRLYPEDISSKTTITVVRNGVATDSMLLSANTPSYRSKQ